MIPSDMVPSATAVLCDGTGAARAGGAMPGIVRGIDHVGIIVRDAESATRYYVETLGLVLVGDEIAAGPGARLVYLAAGDDRVQLVQPVQPGPVADWLDQHGEGVHHVCFRVDDIPDALVAIGGQDGRPIFRGGRGRRACFLGGTPEGVAIELTETEPLE